MFVLGIVLIALAVAMVVVARPADGVCAPFLRVWALGQSYVLGAMVSALTGITLMINNWPF
jgi:hypothetical protein